MPPKKSDRRPLFAASIITKRHCPDNQHNFESIEVIQNRDGDTELRQQVASLQNTVQVLATQFQNLHGFSNSNKLCLVCSASTVNQPDNPALYQPYTFTCHMENQLQTADYT